MSTDHPIQYDLIRERLRRQGEIVDREVALNHRNGAYRTTLMAIAMDEYDDVPDSYRQVYDPDTHCLIIDLPDPETRETTLADY